MNTPPRRGADQHEIKNILIVVRDMERSRRFYHDLFGLDLVAGNDGNMILTDGLVLHVHRLTTHSQGQTVTRFYDPDGNLIEAGTPM